MFERSMPEFEKKMFQQDMELVRSFQSWHKTIPQGTVDKTILRVLLQSEKMFLVDRMLLLLIQCCNKLPVCILHSCFSETGCSLQNKFQPDMQLGLLKRQDKNTLQDIARNLGRNLRSEELNKIQLDTRWRSKILQDKNILVGKRCIHFCALSQSGVEKFH